MPIKPETFPSTPALVRVRAGEEAKLALWIDGVLRDLTAAADARLHTLDALLGHSREAIQGLLDDRGLRSMPPLDIDAVELLAPVESQEVWAAGVTYLRSREARMEEAAAKDIYSLVYRAERPELFFKGVGWRVVPGEGQIGVRPDSTWDVPEPELAVLSNAQGEIVGYSCGNDMSSRSIEGANPLYLPQAKVYDASASIGPAAALAWHVDLRQAAITMTIERGGVTVFVGTARVEDMVREPAELVGVLHSAYRLPVGAWLLTGTGIVPPLPYTAEPGDVVSIQIAGMGELHNTVRRVEHTGARAPARLPPNPSAP
jgi:2-dehydro-3-deoxy-D-arabinonate dehydratase